MTQPQTQTDSHKPSLRHFDSNVSSIHKEVNHSQFHILHQAGRYLATGVNTSQLCNTDALPIR